MAQKGGPVKAMTKQMPGGYANKPTGGKGVGVDRGGAKVASPQAAQVPTAIVRERKSDDKAKARGRRNGPDK